MSSEAKTTTTTSSSPPRRPGGRLARWHLAPYVYRRFWTREELRALDDRTRTWLWPNGTMLRIRYLYQTGVEPQESAEGIVTKALCNNANSWLRYANLAIHTDNTEASTSRTRSRRLPTHPAEIRIRFEEKGGTFWSYFGIDGAYAADEQETMVFDTLHGLDESLFLHEFGHALGLNHEHQRWIRDGTLLDRNKVRISRPHKSEDDLADDIFKKIRRTSMDPFPWDSRSVMHYHFSEEETINGEKIAYNDELSKKDASLIAYLYPLPAGGHERVRLTATANPGAKRASSLIKLRHPWSSIPRVLLGVSSMCYPAITTGVEICLDARARTREHFRLNTRCSNLHDDEVPTVSWLAIDPLMVHVQTPFRNSLISSSSALDETNHHLKVDIFELMPHTSSEATVMSWISSLSIANTAQDFEFMVETDMILSYWSKKLVLNHYSSPGVTMSSNWMVLNPQAINIETGHENNICSATNLEGEVRLRKLGRDHYDDYVKSRLKVFAGITGLKFRKIRDLDDHDVFFRIETQWPGTFPDAWDSDERFHWKIHVCHPECFESLSFSWVAVQDTTFSIPKCELPKGANKPVPYRSRGDREKWARKRRRQQKWQDLRPLPDDVYDGMRDLFADGYDGSES